MTLSLLPRERSEIAPGAVHVPDWLDVDEQGEIVDQWRRWSTGAVPMRATRLPGGGVMSVETVCLVWQWLPYRYVPTAEDWGGRPGVEFSDWLVAMGQRAVKAAYGDRVAAAAYRPDVALANWYGDGARMGMHQDKDERSLGPIVSLSIGDNCVFRFGNTEHRNRPYTDVELCSGDLFVFGGPSRLAFHGVTKVLAGTADPATGLTSGRLNLTMRETGLERETAPGRGRSGTDPEQRR
ncbi:alpha-ketoglutarate-dependent dioxygenase AlkB [soil metagenome]